jgi:hypothetical protein
MMYQDTSWTNEERRALDALMDTLLPGGSGFPPATATGMSELLLARLAASDPAMPALLLAMADTGHGQPADAAGWHEVAYRIEVINPQLFDSFRKQVYLAYYEQPVVIAAIRSLGIAYNDKPLPEGYPDARFMPEVDTPSHRRGKWIPTNEVQRVDLSGLDLGDMT